MCVCVCVYMYRVYNFSRLRVLPSCPPLLLSPHLSSLSLTLTHPHPHTAPLDLSSLPSIKAFAATVDPPLAAFERYV